MRPISAVMPKMMVNRLASCQCQACPLSLATRTIKGSITTQMKATNILRCADSSCTEAMQ